MSIKKIITKKNIFFFCVAAFFVFVYLNLTYSRIYNRYTVPDLSFYWTKPISFKNPTFQNTVKYVALGDSLSVGIGSDNPKKSLPYILAGKLARNMSVQLINLAVLGATADDITQFQLDRAIAEKPNYVTVFIGTNDVHALIPAVIFRDKLDYIIKNLASQTQAKIIIFNVPYLGSKSLILFPYNLFFDYKIRQYNTEIETIAKNNNVLLIDLYTPTKEFEKQTNFYSVDSFHPSGEGYIMWGNLVLQKNL